MPDLGLRWAQRFRRVPRRHRGVGQPDRRALLGADVQRRPFFPRRIVRGAAAGHVPGSDPRRDDLMLKGSAPSSVPETIVDGEVHVWRTRLDATAGAVATLWATLSPDEMGKAERMRFRRDGRRFVVARGILRSLLGAYLEADASDLRFEYGAHGKPF